MKVDWKKVIEQIKKRAWGPLGSIVLHILAVVVLLNFAVGGGTEMGPTTEAVIMETRAEKLEEASPEIEKEIKEEIEKIPEPTEPVETPPDHEVLNTAEYSPTEEISPISNPGVGRGLGTGTGTGVGDGDGAGFQISGAKSPLVMKGLFGSRSSGGRGRALSKYGGGGATEGAVLRALRWLKKEQKADGSWDAPPTAITSWALLCYLAHGETPASEEFGPTVEKAIRYLVSTQSSWPRSYQWQIATYAIAEAYGMTKVPMLKDAADKGLDVIIKGQRPTGGWCYALSASDPADDTSVMGWCAQALKAAKLAGIEHEGLDACIKQAIKGFKGNAAPTGGFGYRGPGNGGLTGVGVLCMQLLGAAKEPEVRNGLTAMDSWMCKWDDAGGTQLYYWYYATQAKFHAGGDIWNNWNKQFSMELVKNQIVLRGAGADGKDIGYWDLPAAEKKGISTGLAFNTTLCCLMLEVYYRYLPTYKPPEDAKMETDTGGGGSSDINIEVK
jgi:hypothetical protein